MAIKSSAFSRVELSGKDATRFVQHMNEDKANPLALARGREISEKIKKGEAFRLEYIMKPVEAFAPTVKFKSAFDQLVALNC